MVQSHSQLGLYHLRCLPAQISSHPSNVALPGFDTRQDRNRIEIQALRAIAVTLVLVYHLWPGRLTGGYVGVDVFFVISGFLITSHLMREVHRSGRISLLAFWTRRARRLLPASLLVLIVVALATVLLIPDTYWRQYMTEVGASALYIENWLLASNAVDYLAAANVASPVQHFWSLSAEEQFYLIWPVLILAAAAVTKRRSQRARSAAVLAVLGSVTLASFVTSVCLDQPTAAECLLCDAHPDVGVWGRWPSCPGSPEGLTIPGRTYGFAGLLGRTRGHWCRGAPSDRHIRIPRSAGPRPGSRRAGCHLGR